MGKKERSIYKNLGLALAATPMVSLFGLIIITLFGALDNAITNIQSAGNWWLILIVAYIISLIYFIYEPKIRQNRKRKELVNGLILYWEEQLEKQDKLQKSNIDIEFIRKNLLERIKVWAWFDPKLWTEYFPDEKYSKYIFGIVDNFMAYLQDQKKITKKNKSK